MFEYIHCRDVGLTLQITQSGQLYDLFFLHLSITFFVEQGNAVKSTIANFRIPAASMSSCDILSTPLVSRFKKSKGDYIGLTQLQRMGYLHRCCGQKMFGKPHGNYCQKISFVKKECYELIQDLKQMADIIHKRYERDSVKNLRSREVLIYFYSTIWMKLFTYPGSKSEQLCRYLRNLTTRVITADGISASFSS